MLSLRLESFLRGLELRACPAARVLKVLPPAGLHASVGHLDAAYEGEVRRVRQCSKPKASETDRESYKVFLKTLLSQIQHWDVGNALPTFAFISSGDLLADRSFEGSPDCLLYTSPSPRD